ncbi:MAG: DUF302 domain-containing protein [Candidatus Solibacter sp.]|jgi:uncharacterized protein (DUF302 family)
MLQIHTTQGLDQIEVGLRMAAQRHGGRILAVSHVGQLLQPEMDLKGADAIVFTMCFPSLYSPLLRADIRFAAFLPSRIAACAVGSGIFLETIPPREYCRLLHRPEVEPLAAALEDTLRLVMDEAAHGVHASAAPGDRVSTEDQVNMRATLPQRIDCLGTKVEELAGTGVPDTQGG